MVASNDYFFFDGDRAGLAQAVGILCGLAWLITTIILVRVQLVSGTSRAILASHDKPWLEEWVLTRDDRVSAHVPEEMPVIREVSLARLAQLQRAEGGAIGGFSGSNAN